MKYNIDYEIMGMLITLVIAFMFRMNYVSRTRSDKAFMKLIYFILLAQALDMLTAFTFSLETPKLNAFNLLMTTGYFFSAFATAVCFERYIASYLPEESDTKAYMIVRYTLIALYCLHGVLNPYTKLAFYFDADGIYHHGHLYYLGYAAPALFALSSMYQIIRYHKYFARKQWISSISFLLVVFVAMILQMGVFPDVYLTFGLIPIALLMILLSLETPDYRKLMQTMEELEKAKQEAWRANQIKSAFLANMSHEIRTPINAVLGFDEMILRESSDEDVLSYAKNIKNSGQTLLNLVNDILDLSKIEAGKMEIVNTEYDLVPRLSDILKMITPRAEEKGLILNIKIDPSIPRKLIGDDVRIGQALTNLLTNAVKYTPKGTVTLMIQLKESRRDTVTLYFAVRDTGIGIRDEDKEKLFSEFSRVEGEKTHKIEGTGLGLPITMKCLMLMGSKLEVESKLGEGSCFYFLLSQKIADPSPIGDFEKARTDGKNEVKVFHEDFTAPDARILVVDDVDLNLKVFKGLLKKSKLQIDTALSGARAIELIHHTQYDCIFMDHQMPEMDGIETLEKLKADETARINDVPIIALTANAIAGAREMYLQKGFSDYLTKPIDGWSLLGMLHKWLPKDKIHEMTKTAQSKPQDASQDHPQNMIFLEFVPEEETLDGEAAITDIPNKINTLRTLGIDVETGLGYAMQEEDFYLELVGDFVNDKERMSSVLQDAFDKKDWKNYQINVHALKSTSKTIGATAFSEKARELEFAARDADEKLLTEKHGLLMEQYDELTKRIKTAL